MYYYRYYPERSSNPAVLEQAIKYGILTGSICCRRTMKSPLELDINAVSFAIKRSILTLGKCLEYIEDQEAAQLMFDLQRENNNV